MLLRWWEAAKISKQNSHDALKRAARFCVYNNVKG